MTTAVESFDPEVEKATLGACLIDGGSNTAQGLLARGLRPEHFYYEQHSAVFKAIASLADRSSGIDTLTVGAELDRLGLRERATRADIDDLAGWVPSAGNFGYYADRVIELARWRDRLRAAYEMEAAATAKNDEAFARARAMLDSATAGTRTESYSPERWASLMFDYYSDPEGNDHAIPLPFASLTDAMGGGVWPGEVLVVSGPTSHGKSAWVDQILDHAAGLGRSCHLYMTEMTAIARGMRYLTRRTGVPFMRQRRRNLTDADRTKIMAELQRFAYGVTVAADWSVDDIVRDALRARYDLVVVDLLHGFHYEDERGLDRLSKAMQRLARVSTTLDGHPGTAVIAVTHLKEEGVRDGKIPRPTLTSIKGGASIKQDADFVMFVWQDQEDMTPTGEGEIWIPKARSGETVRLEVTLSSARFRFHLRDPLPSSSSSSTQSTVF